MPSRPSTTWLRTDENDEFIDALQHSAWLASKVSQNVRAWKWLVLAIHSAVQGACTCALRGHDTAGISMLRKNSAKAVWCWRNVESRQEQPGPMPREELANMLELYERVREECYLPEPHRLSATPQMTKDIERLNGLRNNFIHFVPRGLSLEVNGIPRIIRHCCDVIEHLAVREPTFRHHLDESQNEAIKTALRNLRLKMDDWEKGHAATS